jgi:formylglycine-generating enzyme required for sulfatase activity
MPGDHNLRQRGQAGCLDKTKRDKPVIVGLRMRAILDLIPELEAKSDRLARAVGAGAVGFAGGGKNTIGMTFVRLAPGRFAMGCTADPEDQDECEPDELPIRQVGIRKPFLMQTTEVTQRQWRTVMETEEEPPFRLNPSENSWCGSDCPVDSMTWLEAVTFANLLSGQEGLRAAYKISGTRVKWDRTANGYRLPTEAEWEYAARAGQGTIYSGANEPYRAGWYDQNSDGPLKVAGGEPNYWGLYDMTGSLWEWCWDWYGEYVGDADDPTGPKSGRDRVLRGGSWCHPAHYARNSYRNFLPQSSGKDRCTGFRLVRSTR